MGNELVRLAELAVQEVERYVAGVPATASGASRGSGSHRVTGIRPGLCSVTLRAQTVDDIARIAGECGLDGIEWGADVHVPPGDAVAARRARSASAAADLVVASYGSYLFALGTPTPGEHGAVLETAVAIGAPNVRVWAGLGVSLGSDASRELVAGLARFCRAADEHGLSVSLEFHGGTPTGTVEGALAVIESVAAPNLFSYWQPPYWRTPTSPTADAAAVVALAARLSHLHVYEWSGPEQRQALAVGDARWRAVLDRTAAIEGRWAGDRYAFLEFVTDDSADAVVRDAAVLRGWLGRA